MWDLTRRHDAAGQATAARCSLAHRAAPHSLTPFCLRLNRRAGAPAVLRPHQKHEGQAAAPRSGRCPAQRQPVFCWGRSGGGLQVGGCWEFRHLVSCAGIKCAALDCPPACLPAHPPICPPTHLVAVRLPTVLQRRHEAAPECSHLAGWRPSGCLLGRTIHRYSRVCSQLTGRVGCCCQPGC